MTLLRDGSFPGLCPPCAGVQTGRWLHRYDVRNGSPPLHPCSVCNSPPIPVGEWGHFRKVLKELNKRDLSLGKPRKDDYVNKLAAFKKKGGSRNDQLLEELLLCALIEARSCERFRLLSLHITDDDLKQFYHEFMVSEAGHYRMFIDLAKTYCDPEKVKKRWDEFLAFEAEIIAGLEWRSDRVH